MEVDGEEALERERNPVLPGQANIFRNLLTLPEAETVEARPEGAQAVFGCDRDIHPNYRAAVWATSQVKDHKGKKVPKEQYKAGTLIPLLINRLTKLNYRSEKKKEGYIISQLHNRKDNEWSSKDVVERVCSWAQCFRMR